VGQRTPVLKNLRRKILLPPPPARLTGRRTKLLLSAASLAVWPNEPQVRAFFATAPDGFEVFVDLSEIIEVI